MGSQTTFGAVLRKKNFHILTVQQKTHVLSPRDTTHLHAPCAQERQPNKASSYERATLTQTFIKPYHLQLLLQISVTVPYLLQDLLQSQDAEILYRVMNGRRVPESVISIERVRGSSRRGETD